MNCSILYNFDTQKDISDYRFNLEFVLMLSSILKLKGILSYVIYRYTLDIAVMIQRKLKIFYLKKHIDA